MYNTWQKLATQLVEIAIRDQKRRLNRIARLKEAEERRLQRDKAQQHVLYGLEVRAKVTESKSKGFPKAPPTRCHVL